MYILSKIMGTMFFISAGPREKDFVQRRHYEKPT